MGSDLLYASHHGVSYTPNEMELNFHHMLTSVEVVLKAGGGLTAKDLENVLVSVCNTKLRAYFLPEKVTEKEMENRDVRAKMVQLSKENNETINISFATKIAADNVSDLASAEHAIVVIVPQTVNGNFIEVDFGDDVRKLYYEVNNMTFESGKRYIYNIIVNPTELSVAFETKDWLTK